LSDSIAPTLINDFKGEPSEIEEAHLMRIWCLARVSDALGSSEGIGIARENATLSPAVRGVALQDGKFTLTRGDALAPASARCDIRQAMNLWIYPFERASELLAEACLRLLTAAFW
jgi:hypothetical protein